MAITHNAVDVTWPTAANSISVSSGSAQNSEEFNINDTCVAAQVQLKADNGGTPADGDIVFFYLLQTLGDPDGAEPGTDEFDTNNHALFLAQLDTWTSGNGDDPAITTVPLPIPNKGCQIRAVNNATSNSITVSATVLEQRAA